MQRLLHWMRELTGVERVVLGVIVVLLLAAVCLATRELDQAPIFTRPACRGEVK